MTDPPTAQLTTPRVAAVVVTYNRKDLLRQCLEALQEQTHPVSEIIVVDNASTDGTTPMIQSEFPEVTLHVLEENRGGAGGFHAGMKIASSQDVDWIWVMDDDAEPKSDALEELFNPGIHDHSEVVALASLKVTPEGRRQPTHAGMYNPVTMTKTAVDSRGPNVESIEFSSFVGLMVRTNVVEQIGLPEAGYFIWGDDTEYSLRLLQVGKLYLIRNSRIVHHDYFAPSRKRATLLSSAWRERPLKQYWRNYYKLRNRLLLVHAYAETALEEWIGYAVGFGRFLQSAVAVLAFDDHKIFRLNVLWRGFRHGVEGQDGKYYDPDRFCPDAHSCDGSETGMDNSKQS